MCQRVAGRFGPVFVPHTVRYNGTQSYCFFNIAQNALSLSWNIIFALWINKATKAMIKIRAPNASSFLVIFSCIALELAIAGIVLTSQTNLDTVHYEGLRVDAPGIDGHRWEGLPVDSQASILLCEKEPQQIELFVFS